MNQFIMSLLFCVILFYIKLAMTTLNPELSKRDVLINSVMGLCGESGEAIDIEKNGWLKDMNWTRNIWQRNLEM